MTLGRYAWRCGGMWPPLSRVASFIAPGSDDRALVEVEQAPAAAGPLEHRERAVVLATRQEPSGGEPGRPADQRAIGPAVRDDRDRLPRVRRGERIERRPRAGFQIGNALALRKRKLADVRHPPRALL